MKSEREASNQITLVEKKAEYCVYLKIERIFVMGFQKKNPVEQQGRPNQ